MEHTWTKDFYQETDPAKRQQILKDIAERGSLGRRIPGSALDGRYGQRRLRERMNLSNA